MPTYEVIGTREVLAHQPGDVFEDLIDPVMEVRLVVGGHIRRVEPEIKVEKTEEKQRYVGQPRDGEATDRADELERELEA